MLQHFLLSDIFSSQSHHALYHHFLSFPCEWALSIAFQASTLTTDAFSGCHSGTLCFLFYASWSLALMMVTVRERKVWLLLRFSLLSIRLFRVTVFRKLLLSCIFSKYSGKYCGFILTIGCTVSSHKSDCSRLRFSLNWWKILVHRIRMRSAGRGGPS